MIKKRKNNNLVNSLLLVFVFLLGFVITVPTGLVFAEANSKTKPFRYKRKGRRDVFRPLYTKESVAEEMKKKREAEFAKREAERKKSMEEQQEAGNIFQKLFSAETLIKPEPQVMFPSVNIAGIMWDPYAPVLTLADNNHVYRNGEFIRHQDGDMRIVEIRPDSIVIEKTQDGVTKQKHVGIIRYEEDTQ